MRMKSIKTKSATLTIISILVTVLVMTLIAIISIKDIGTKDTEQMLFLLCETGEKNLDSYFGDIENSVEIVAEYIEDNLRGIDEISLKENEEKARDIFNRTAKNTNGVLTYYYRIDPEISKEVKGFWYIDINGNGFIEHEVTDLSNYDTEDTSSIVWFTVPKKTGKSVWLPPYETENLAAYVLSYNKPIYYKGTFVGVVGIEIDYSTMAEQVNNIKLFNNGYAFINDKEGNIIYHPKIDATKLTDETKPRVPAGLLSYDNLITYNYEGVDKKAVWLTLNNGMRLNVTVPLNEINANWERLMLGTLTASILLMALFIYIALRATEKITEPLNKLTEIASQVNNGNYEFELDYEGNDEVGVLAKVFKKLVNYLKVYIGDLNDLAYADALTSVHNKGAFDIKTKELEEEIKKEENQKQFAIAIFDCDNLKTINDEYGHDKGDVYLKTSSALICKVFKHSPVYRIGGDEFAVVLVGEDLANENFLVEAFERECKDTQERQNNPWNKVSVSMGIAHYDPKEDKYVSDVVRRADKLMYENKNKKKLS